MSCGRQFRLALRKRHASRTQFLTQRLPLLCIFLSLQHTADDLGLQTFIEFICFRLQAVRYVPRLEKIMVNVDRVKLRSPICIEIAAIGFDTVESEPVKVRRS